MWITTKQQKEWDKLIPLNYLCVASQSYPYPTIYSVENQEKEYQYTVFGIWFLKQFLYRILYSIQDTVYPILAYIHSNAFHPLFAKHPQKPTSAILFELSFLRRL